MSLLEFLVTILISILYGLSSTFSYNENPGLAYSIIPVLLLIIWLRLQLNSTKVQIYHCCLFIVFSCFVSRFSFYFDAGYLISSLLNMQLISALILYSVGLMLVTLKSLTLALAVYSVFFLARRKIKSEKLKIFINSLGLCLAIETAISYPICTSPLVSLMAKLPTQFQLSWTGSIVVIPVMIYTFISYVIIPDDKKLARFFYSLGIGLLSIACLAFIPHPEFKTINLANLYFINNKMVTSPQMGQSLGTKVILKNLQDKFPNYKTSTVNTFIWPEVIFYVNQNNIQINSIKEELLKELPGTHFLGVFLSTNSGVENQYIKFSSVKKSETTIYLKRRLVPVVEDGYILPGIFEKLGYSRIKGIAGKSDTVLFYENLKWKIRLCSEIGDVHLNVLFDDFKNTDLILSPSNISSSIKTDIDEKYSTYSKIISRFSGVSVLRTSSSNDVKLFRPDGKVIQISSKDSFVHHKEIILKNVIQ